MKNLVLLWTCFLLLVGEAIAQNKQVSGTVTDEQGEPVIGASVIVKGNRSVGTVTDENGAFSIVVPDVTKAILQIFLIGYQLQEIAVSGRNQLPVVKLITTVTELEDLVVTGYRTISPERNTGSYGIVTSRKIDNKLSPDLKQALEGQIAGLVFDRDGKVEIRGVSSFSAVKTPLLVIDGYPVDATMNDSYFSFRDGTFENINTQNIENITVLKDAVAASIYGSRAANGVIVITTKKGVEGDPKISYRGTYSVVTTPSLRNLYKASASDYIDAEIDLFNQSASSDLNASVTEATYILIQQKVGVITAAEAEAKLNALRNRDYIGEVEKYLFRPKLQSQHNVSINGGTKKHSYNMVFNFLNTREHFFQAGNNRAVVDLRDEWKINRFITLGANVNIAYSTSHSPKNNTEINTSSMFSFTGTDSRFTPYSQLADTEGNRVSMWVPGWQARKTLYAPIPGAKSIDYVLMDELEREKVTTIDFQSRLTGFLRINIIEGLSAEVGGNWQRGGYNWKQISDAESYIARIAYTNTTSRSNPANHYIPDGSIIDERRNNNESWTLRSQINFDRDFNEGNHRINLLGGSEIRRMTYDNNTYATRVGYNPTAGSFIPVNIPAISSGTYQSDYYGSPGISLTSGAYGLTDNRFVSWYGNGSYEYDNRFIISGSIRLDLTNFFGTSPEYRYRPLWSIGGTYKLSEESFFNIDGISRLHVRGSYGVSGNIALNQGPFLILGVGSYNATMGGTSYSISSPPNDQLRWEKTQTSNLGVDMTTFNNRLKVTLDYYNRLSTDLLAPDAVDPTKGFTTITKNIGSMSNKGIEASISIDLIRNRDFKWNLTHIFAYNHNKVLSYNASRSYTTNYYMGTSASEAGAIHVAGYPADSFWGGKFAGLDEKGTVQAYKADGTKVPIANLTPEDMFFQGSARPKFDLSLTNSFTYHNWELSAMLIAKLGHHYRKDAFTGSNIQNRHVGERWRQPGDEAKTIYPALSSWNMDMFYFPFTDVLIGNASYAKLRDVMLSYNIGKALLNKIGIAGARVYFQARNLMTIKAKGTDIDPESFEYNLTRSTGAYTDQGSSSLPFPKEFYIGLQISL